MFNLGKLQIEGNVFLAPMASISDSPYRLICRRSGAGFSFTEFVSAEALIRDNPKTIAMFRFVPEERPIIFQIFGSREDSLLTAALRAEEFGPDVIDVNMGCSVKKVTQSGSGAGLLKDPEKVSRIISTLSRRLSVPVTAKIRLGWDHSSRNYREITRRLEDAGAAMISVHGRTRSDAYRGRADWDAIGEIKNMTELPVLGNGDIKSYREALEKKEQYGVDGVLIGRAAIGNPWIFAGRERDSISRSELVEMLIYHMELMCKFYDQGVILFRKHVARYIVGFPGAREFRLRLMSVESPDEFRAICRELLATAEPESDCLSCGA